MRVCCFRVTVPAVQYDSRISSGSRDRIPCRTLSRLFDALGSLARGQLPAFLPRASGIRSHPPNPRELFRMGYMKGFTSVRICTGRITRTVTPEDSVLFARYLRVLASQQVISMSGIYRGVRTRVYPGRQARPIRAASTFLVTGMGPGSSGDLARSWVVTQLWLHLYHQFTKRSGRRAPVLEHRSPAL